MSGAVVAPKASFARNNDFFVYKRIRDVAEFTEASSVGTSPSVLQFSRLIVALVFPYSLELR